MKTYTKFLLTVGLLSLASAGLVQAQTIVRITGSSAYRGAVTNAILHLLTSPTAGYVGSSLAGANTQIIEGTLTNTAGSFTAGTAVIFKTSWTGSLSGIVALTTNGNTANPFLSTSNTGLASATAGTGSDSTGATGGAVLSSPIFDAAQVADVAMSDVFQSSTKFTSPALGSPAIANGFAPANGIVGVVPFVWVAGAADSAGKITNISSNQVLQLMSTGLNEAQITGNINDENNGILPTGRDPDSGTRFNALADSGYNVVGAAPTPVVQYYVNTSGGGSTVTEFASETLPTLGAVGAGNAGYSSGSAVATDLENANTNNATNNGVNNTANQSILIGYVSEGDGATAVQANTGAHFVSWNGVSYGSYSGGTVTYNRTLIDNGTYTFWGYEHEYYRSGNADAAIANALSAQIANTDAAVSGELLGNMQCSVGIEGGPISFGQP